MKFLIKTVLIVILAYIGQIFLPFWVVALAGLLVSLAIKTNGFVSFFSGFTGAFILWCVSAYFINDSAQGILSEKMITIIPVGSVIGLILVTALIGGLVGGFGSLTGSLLGSAFGKSEASKY